MPITSPPKILAKGFSTKKIRYIDTIRNIVPKKTNPESIFTTLTIYSLFIAFIIIGFDLSCEGAIRDVGNKAFNLIYLT